jgi:hypothetical protein
MLQGLMGKIMFFIAIIITLALAPYIYTANSAIIAWGDLTPFLGLEVVVGFGAFIIILGLLVQGGFFAFATVKSRTNGGMRDILQVVGSVVVILVVLSIFPTILDYMDDLITAAVAASDGLGEVGFGILPVVLYLGVIAAAGWSGVSTYRRVTGRGRRGSKSSAARLGYV